MTQTPTAINVRMQSRLLEIDFDQVSFSLPFELLRVASSGRQGSNILTAMSISNCYIVLPSERNCAACR